MQLPPKSKTICVVPANDDSIRTIELITGAFAEAVQEGKARSEAREAEEAAADERVAKETESHEETEETNG